MERLGVIGLLLGLILIGFGFLVTPGPNHK